jgi:hypothetical protein
VCENARVAQRSHDGPIFPIGKIVHPLRRIFPLGKVAVVATPRASTALTPAKVLPQNRRVRERTTRAGTP